jgi:TetR/AcrR family transcriptional regulator, cholesterol catabolism regulator
MVRRIATQVQSNQLVADRREQIIQAAIAVFHRKGFHVATTSDIATEAGLTQSNLYNYVNSKQDVLLLVCEHLVGLYNRILDETVSEQKSAHVCLVETVEALIQIMSTHRDEVQLLYHETHSLEKPDRIAVLKMLSDFIGRFEQLVERYEKEKEPLAIRHTRLVANFLSFVPAIVALRSWDLESKGLRSQSQSILKFILAGLGIPELKRR